MREKKEKKKEEAGGRGREGGPRTGGQRVTRLKRRDSLLDVRQELPREGTVSCGEL